MVCLCAAPRVKLFINVGSEWPHDAPRNHSLLPICCHLWVCEVLLVACLTHISIAIASIHTYCFTFFTFLMYVCVCKQDKVNKIYSSQLECFVQYKTMRDYSLTVEKTHFPPWCLTLDTTGTAHLDASLLALQVLSNLMPHSKHYRYCPPWCLSVSTTGTAHIGASLLALQVLSTFVPYCRHYRYCAPWCLTLNTTGTIATLSHRYCCVRRTWY